MKLSSFSLLAAITISNETGFTKAFTPVTFQRTGIQHHLAKPSSLFMSTDSEDETATEASVVVNGSAEETVLEEVVEEVIEEMIEEEVFEEAEVESNSSDEETEQTMKGSLLEISQIKNSLLSIAASSDRGQFASEQQKQDSSDLISQLEELNPDEDTISSKAQGTWELVYSDTQLFRSSPFFMAGRAVCETEEQAKQYDWFCDMHRAALAISTIGKVRQIISSSELISEFEVKVGAVPFVSDFLPAFVPFSRYSGGLPLTIEGAIVSTASIEDTSSEGSYDLFMNTVEIKGSNIPLLRQVLDNPEVKLNSRALGGFLEENVPNGAYENPKPKFKTTFLDESLRISRDQDGKVFVYTKVCESTECTKYYTMSDLGVGKLLEGFNDAITKIYI